MLGGRLGRSLQYGFNVQQDGVVETQFEDDFPETSRRVSDCESDYMDAVEAIDLLDGFYGHPEVSPVGEPICVITKWGYEWIRRALFGDVSIKKFTKQVVQELDVEDKDPLDYVETHIYSNEHIIECQGETTKIEVVRREKKVLRKGKRSRFASAIAHQAYNKFGARQMTEANVLVTRRWLQKLLAEPEYKDLRTVDKNIAIDRALFLSFVPTNDFRKMKLAVATRAWQDRVDPRGLLGGIFGRAFMLVRNEIPDDMVLH
jgi:hypothetical protein